MVQPQFTSVVTTEIPHKLSVGDRVRIRNVKSSTNTTGADNSGYNGLFCLCDTDIKNIYLLK